MTQPLPPNNPPPPNDPRPLDYQTPQQPPSYNRWWMVLGRIVLGILAGLVSFGMGLWIASLTNVPLLMALPPLLMLGTLLFVCIKYRRFGYVTGFILAPFLAVSALVILVLIICGTGAWKS